jgi:hypothetical protein
MYSEDSPSVSGEAIRAENIQDSDSRIDSNNFSGLGTPFPDVAIGVYINTPLKIRYNNFYDVTVPYTGANPTDDSGNISADPLYEDIGANDFRLKTGSPNIDSADPDKWVDAWLGITGGNIPNATPFNRNKDRLGARRNYVEPDIGAFEYITGINGDSDTFVSESGFDLINTGGETGPFATLDRAFQDTKDLSVDVNPVAGYTGVADISGLGRYRSKNITFAGSNKIDIGVSGLDNTALINSSYPSMSANKVYVSPDGGDTGYFVVGGVTGAYDGSYTGPYRSIDAAISASSAENIILFPGLYPEFTGEAGRSLIGISKTTSIDKGGKVISKFLKEEWGLTGTADFEFNKLKVYDSSSVLYGIDLTNPLEIHLKIDSSDDFILDISNNTNGLSIKKSTSVSISHTIDGITYSVPAPSIGDEMSLNFILSGNAMRYTVKGNGVSYSKTVTLNGDYSNGFKFSVKDVSGNPVSVSSLRIANNVTGSDNIEKVYKSTFGIRDEG